MIPESLQDLDWEKLGGIVPAIVQDALSGTVLMLGFMTEESLAETLRCGRVVFFSRSRGQLWLKGETSGNFLDVVQVTTDCDRDSLLILAKATGPTCHKGTQSCFAEARPSEAQRLAFLSLLEETIRSRIADNPDGSYTARLFAQGPSRMAQKVGEEGLETALAAVTRDDDGVVSESADLLYHLLVLLKARGLSLARVVRELESRHGARP
jgi:phosphoribosyl-ATP pyrophosphohydrolase/phosphoribosyl-AMP cyclohydrolase